MNFMGGIPEGASYTREPANPGGDCQGWGRREAVGSEIWLDGKDCPLGARVRRRNRCRAIAAVDRFQDAVEHTFELEKTT